MWVRIRFQLFQKFYKIEKLVIKRAQLLSCITRWLFTKIRDTITDRGEILDYHEEQWEIFSIVMAIIHYHLWLAFIVPIRTAQIRKLDIEISHRCLSDSIKSYSKILINFFRVPYFRMLLHQISIKSTSPLRKFLCFLSKFALL